ncbi:MULTISPECIES: hypothetical protein [Myxococcus]|uniref:hypothetical protein n=1 Tax=Myxococcus TaxID=32 RepID=UPI0011440F07|nr:MULTISPECIES: hypothetical protein [Myxococcus]MCK8502347.1 hypothetical protein [Myxococcus fulvus]
MENTYGAPAGDGFPRSNPKDAVSVPAILLMVLAGVSLLWAMFSLLSPVNPDDMEQLFNNPALAPYRDAMEQNRALLTSTTSFAGRLMWYGPVILLNALAFFGALKMKQLQNWGLAVAGGFASLVPCCGTCGCLALPISIWALVVLFKPEVKAAFR